MIVLKIVTIFYFTHLTNFIFEVHMDMTKFEWSAADIFKFGKVYCVNAPRKIIIYVKQRYLKKKIMS